MSGDRSGAFEALADPTRRAILRVLADQGETSAGRIASEVEHVGRTGVSSHLRILRGSGLVKERRVGRYRLYSLEARRRRRGGGLPDDAVPWVARGPRATRRGLDGPAGEWG
jgi:DNA-binding transcriptional ArsR family regulator